MSFFSIFVKFSLILAPQNQPNLIQFPFQTQEWPHCENRRFLMRKLQFWQVWRVKSWEKNDQKSIQNFDRKMKWKKMSKTAFFTPKAFQNGVQNPLKLVFKNHVKKMSKNVVGVQVSKGRKLQNDTLGWDCAGYPIHSYNPLLMHHPGPIEHILPHLPILLIFVFGIGSRMVFRTDLTINIWNWFFLVLVFRITV